MELLLCSFSNASFESSQFSSLPLEGPSSGAHPSHFSFLSIIEAQPSSPPPYYHSTPPRPRPSPSPCSVAILRPRVLLRHTISCALLPPPCSAIDWSSTMGALPAKTSSSALVLPVQQQNQETLSKPSEPSKPKKKICCACPDTKKLRDECIVEHGEAACAKWIEAHKQCLRAEGFNV
ncbi:hypothetical protein Ancab_025427 [Ancistrocladus abbreviatus]